MPARSRPPEPREDDDPFATWMTEITVTVERLGGRVEANDRTVERLTAEVRSSTEVSRAATIALERIARAEEAREQREAAREKREEKQEIRRGRLIDRLWDVVTGSSAFQLLLAGIALAILQGLQTAYIADRFLPPVPTSPPSSAPAPFVPPDRMPVSGGVGD